MHLMLYNIRRILVFGFLLAICGSEHNSVMEQDTAMYSNASMYDATIDVSKTIYIKTYKSSLKYVTTYNYSTISREHECRETKSGETYTGTVSTTTDGWSCEYWVNIEGTIEGMQAKDFPDESVQNARNYCRNPDNDSRGFGV